MLTPQYLDLIEFNDVVELYNKLNIEITADIISRVTAMNDITEITKRQLQILKQTNGTEIFNKTLDKTANLTTQTKNALKKLFIDMTKEDMEGYKELYQYRDKPFILSKKQYEILNQGLKQTAGLLKNMTNTIAFQSKQTYVEAVDSAYFKVSSGAFDYQSAINATCQELANKGVTLKDKLKRNVQLEVAVRRNVLSGIHETANNINRDIEEYLGCNGYEVTAHSGARPTHAEAQGQQYAFFPGDAKKYGVGLWTDVDKLWEEYNCRHTYFGIILGISEAQYTKGELEYMQNETVKLNGKDISYYEATQKQRQIENAIRKQKRAIQILEKTNLDTTVEKIQLSQLQKNYKDFCKETGLEKDYNRTKIANYNSTKTVKSSIMELPNYKNAKIPTEKIVKYVLNPNHPKGKFKAEAFEKALGYNLGNANKLIENIQKNINKFDAIEKEDKGHGKRYEILMTLIGENKRIANVKTAWIIDKITGETRLTSAYVTQKGRKKNKDDNKNV